MESSTECKARTNNHEERKGGQDKSSGTMRLRTWTARVEQGEAPHDRRPGKHRLRHDKHPRAPMCMTIEHKSTGTLLLWTLQATTSKDHPQKREHRFFVPLECRALVATRAEAPRGDKYREQHHVRQRSRLLKVATSHTIGWHVRRTMLIMGTKARPKPQL
eukprot:1159132-Pelagomonas_calceolata.AAC.6